jgi:hypothetical protein
MQNQIPQHGLQSVIHRNSHLPLFIEDNTNADIPDIHDERQESINPSYKDRVQHGKSRTTTNGTESTRQSASSMDQSQSVTKEVINETGNANLLRSNKHHLHSRPRYDKERSNALEQNSQKRKEKTKRSVIIAGDSIIQHVHGWELSNEDYNVTVKSFSGGGVGGVTHPENKLSANEGSCRQTKNNISQNVKLYSLHSRAILAYNKEKL